MTALPFLEKILQLLGHGDYASTYKYAVLIALIDLCVEAGEPPTSVTTEQVARRVIELYWPQVRPYDGGRVLGQNCGVQANILANIERFRAQHPDLALAAAARQRGFEKLIRAVEWTLIEMPLPRLQKIDRSAEVFLYEIGWEEGVTKRALGWSDRSFDNSVRFVPGAAASLVTLSSVLRPLILSQWSAMVVRLNALPDHRDRKSVV